MTFSKVWIPSVTDLLISGLILPGIENPGEGMLARVFSEERKSPREDETRASSRSSSLPSFLRVGR